LIQSWRDGKSEPHHLARSFRHQTISLEPVVCENIVAEMNAAQGDAATVYGRTTSGGVDQNVRRTLRLRPSPETIESITHRLLDCKEAVEKHFAVALNECEDPQFFRYRTGDFFVAHQDGNTGLLRLDSERRLVSTVIFLSRESDSAEPDAHCGGSLVLTNLRAGPNDGKFRMIAEPGTLVAFRSETTHEVTPVTFGERLSIVSWYR
jgi:SM-20-related protein